jgi:aryl-alcohol dehydrogenase-like predicted oxidoreductase
VARFVRGLRHRNSQRALSEIAALSGSGHGERLLLGCQLLEAIGKRHGRTAGEVAIAWVLHNRTVTAAIVGARRPDQVRGVVGAAQFRLSLREIAEIETGFARFAA